MKNVFKKIKMMSQLPPQLTMMITTKLMQKKKKTQVNVPRTTIITSKVFIYYLFKSYIMFFFVKCMSIYLVLVEYVTKLKQTVIICHLFWKINTFRIIVYVLKFMINIWCTYTYLFSFGERIQLGSWVHYPKEMYYIPMYVEFCIR